MREVSEDICRTRGVDCVFEYTHEFAPTVNTAELVDVAARAATNVVVADKVDRNVQPMTISKDFGALLQVLPGNFIFIGNGVQSGKGDFPLHNANYFNDDILAVGSRYFAEIVRLQLPVRQSSFILLRSCALPLRKMRASTLFSAVSLSPLRIDNPFVFVSPATRNDWRVTR